MRELQYSQEQGTETGDERVAQRDDDVAPLPLVKAHQLTASAEGRAEDRGEEGVHQTEEQTGEADGGQVQAHAHGNTRHCRGEIEIDETKTESGTGHLTRPGRLLLLEMIVVEEETAFSKPLLDDRARHW